MKAEIEIEPAIEPMRTRVALHPFLAGMNRSQLALLTDCAMAVQFEKGPDNLPRRRNGESLLLDRNRRNSTRIEQRTSESGDHRYDRRRRIAGVVVDVSAIHVAFDGARCRADVGDFLLRNDFARIL